MRLLVVMLAALALLVPSATYADSLGVTDATGDVWATPSGGTAAPAPGVTKGDITRMVVRNNRTTLVVVVRFVDLAPSGRYAGYDIWLQAHNTLARREFVLEAGPGHWSGTVRDFAANGTLRHCPTTHTIDYAANLVRLTARRSCLGTPSSVRAGLNVYRATRSSGKTTLYSDNPFDTNAESAAWTSWVRRTQ
jgi:hypothetical protein